MDAVSRVSEALVSGLEGVAAQLVSLCIGVAIVLLIAALIIAGIKALFRKIFHK